MSRSWMTGLGLLSAALACGACSSPHDSAADPRKRLSDYISRSFSVKDASERAILESYLAGQAKTRMAAWSEAQFRSAFIDSKRQFLKLVFTDVRNISPAEVAIEYELTYLDQGRGNEAKVTNRKLGTMVQDQGRWYIREVRNIKELVEYRNEMSLP